MGPLVCSYTILIVVTNSVYRIYRKLANTKNNWLSWYLKLNMFIQKSSTAFHVNWKNIKERNITETFNIVSCPLVLTIRYGSYHKKKQHLINCLDVTIAKEKKLHKLLHWIQKHRETTHPSSHLAMASRTFLLQLVKNFLRLSFYLEESSKRTLGHQCCQKCGYYSLTELRIPSLWLWRGSGDTAPSLQLHPFSTLVKKLFFSWRIIKKNSRTIIAWIKWHV